MRFRIELAEVADHPPRFAADQDGLTSEVSRRVTATGALTVPRSVLDAWAASGPLGPVPTTAVPLLPDLYGAVQPIRPWGSFDCVAGRVVVGLGDLTELVPRDGDASFRLTQPGGEIRAAGRTGRGLATPASGPSAEGDNPFRFGFAGPAPVGRGGCRSGTR